jgi:hypothetical protein
VREETGGGQRGAGPEKIPTIHLRLQFHGGFSNVGFRKRIRGSVHHGSVRVDC